MKKRNFSREFKLKVLQEHEAGKPIAEISREYEIKPDIIYRWRKEYNANPALAFSGNGNPSTEETKTAQLERKIGQLYLENEFLKKALTALQSKLAEARRGA